MSTISCDRSYTEDVIREMQRISAECEAKVKTPYTYEKYIASSAWVIKRALRLEFDGHRCVICHATDNLSVHHLHYETLGNEDIQHDLVTLCPNHHHLFDGLERWRRYSLRQRAVTPIESTVSIRQEFSHGLGNSELQIDVRVSDVDAQGWVQASSSQLAERLMVGQGAARHGRVRFGQVGFGSAWLGMARRLNRNRCKPKYDTPISI